MEDFSEAMRLREQADYGLVYSEDSARVSVEDAESFLEETTKILGSCKRPEKETEYSPASAPASRWPSCEARSKIVRSLSERAYVSWNVSIGRKQEAEAGPSN